jgi:hypothetical protein
MGVLALCRLDNTGNGGVKNKKAPLDAFFELGSDNKFHFTSLVEHTYSVSGLPRK